MLKIFILLQNCLIFLFDFSKLLVCTQFLYVLVYLFKGGDIILNQVILVGRLTRDIVVNQSENGTKVATISLAIPRSFKNSDGIYDTDFVDCTAFDYVALNSSEYVKKGDILGVKGRLQSKIVEENNIKKTVYEIICEKVTFLSSKQKEEVES